MDGLNLFSMVRNNSVTFGDPDGRVTNDDLQRFVTAWELNNEFPVVNDEMSSDARHRLINMYNGLGFPSQRVSHGENTASGGGPSLAEGLLSVERQPESTNNMDALFQEWLTAPASGSSAFDGSSVAECPFVCEQCGKGFKRKRGLIQHRKTHSAETPFTCGMCGRDFKLKGYLDKHMDMHGQGRFFVCEVCGKGFMRRGFLEKHRDIHNEEKRLSVQDTNAVTRLKRRET